MNNIQFTPHFELREFVVSKTARDHGFDNTPPAEAVENLRALCVHTLEPLREALGLPIVITSGYRTRELNRLLVNHSRTSQHMEGCAADFYVGQGPVSGVKSQVSGNHMELETGGGPMKLETSSHHELLIKAFKTMILDERITFDQLIIYPTFIHVSYVRSGSNRNKLTKANGHGSFCALSHNEALGLE